MEGDYNEFNSWDCGGAATMLAGVPAVLYFVFSEHDYVGTAVLLAVAAGIGLFVFLVAHLVNSRIVSRLLQLVGIVLCIIYWGYAIHMWSTSSRINGPAAPEQEMPALDAPPVSSAS